MEADENKTVHELAQEKYDAFRVIVALANRLTQWEDDEFVDTHHEVLNQLNSLVRAWAAPLGLNIVTNPSFTWACQEQTLVTYHGTPWNFVQQGE